MSAISNVKVMGFARNRQPGEVDVPSTSCGGTNAKVA